MSIFRFISFVERACQVLLGKGWGSATVDQEVKQVLQFLKGREPTLVIDIGGNKGIYTQKVLKKFPNCKVHIFEPAKVNIKILEQKFMKLNNVTICKKAVSDSSSNAVLYSDIPGSGMASLTKRELTHFNINFDETEDVSTIRFEDYWRNNLFGQRIDLCKLDIEGHEYSALSAFGEALDYVSVFQFEFGGCNIDTRTFFKDFWDFFTKNGYNLFRITPLGLQRLKVYSETDEYFRTSNYLAVRSIPS